MKILLRIFIILACYGLSVPAVASTDRSPSASPSLFQKELVALANTDRTIHGVTPLSTNALLSLAAQKKANDMATKGYFSHYSPLGAAPWQWITNVGYRYTRAGENLAINFDDPAKLQTAWMASPTHRANLVRNTYREVGIGVAYGTYRSAPATFVVAFFATPTKTVTKMSARSPVVLKTF